MRFFGFREGQPNNEVVTPTCEFPEISQREVRKLDERKYPYQSLVRVDREDDKDDTLVFQSLEPADQPEVGLQDYRSNEISKILALLENNQVVSLVAPSRAAKTEAVLFCHYKTVGREDTLYGKTDGYFFDIPVEFPSSLTTDEQIEYRLNRIIESFKEGRDQEPKKIALCDEFIPNSDKHQKILQGLIRRDFKCVIAQGGFLSNTTKQSSIDQLSSQIGLAIPSVEMGIKPFNAKQLAEMAKRKNIEAGPGLNQLIDLSSKIPLPYHIAVKALDRVRRGSVSEEMLWEDLHYEHSRIYSISELKRALK